MRPRAGALFHHGMLSHVPAASVLVIAPDADLRQSLIFVFVANGIDVRTCTHWPPEHQLGQFDAIILDEAAVPRALHDDAAIAAVRDKIILLAGRVAPLAAIPHAHLVRKPLLDTQLLDLVLARIASGTAAK